MLLYAEADVEFPDSREAERDLGRKVSRILCGHREDPNAADPPPAAHPRPAEGSL
jgi:hypothetical protein